MELKEMVEQLLESGIIENQEYALLLMSTPNMAEEDRTKFLDSFIEEYSKDMTRFFSEKNKNIFSMWVEMYNKRAKDYVKSRVHRID